LSIIDVISDLSLLSLTVFLILEIKTSVTFSLVLKTIDKLVSVYIK